MTIVSFCGFEPYYYIRYYQVQCGFSNIYIVRDTARFSGFRKYSAGKTPSLKKLVKEILGVEIQEGEHSSIEDARAAILLFRRHKSAFDTEHAQRFPVHAPGSGAKSKKKKKSKR